MNLPVEDKQQLMLNLSISTKAGETDGNAVPEDLNIWIFADEGTVPLYYKNYAKPVWDKYTPPQGEVEFYTTVSEIVEHTKVQSNLRVYVLLNTSSVSWNPASAMATSPWDELSESALLGAEFTAIDYSVPDNHLLMYGKSELDKLLPGEGASVSVTARRSVAKLELYFTRKSESVRLNVNKVSLYKSPAKGFLVPQTYLPSSDSAEETVLYTTPDASGKEILTVLPVSAAASVSDFASEFDENPSTFTFLEENVRPYIMERKGAQAFQTVESSAFAQTDAYILSLQFYKGTVLVNKHFALHDIERNTRNRIFVRVTEDAVDINVKTTPWVLGKGLKELDITFGMEDLPVVSTD